MKLEKKRLDGTDQQADRRGETAVAPLVVVGGDEEDCGCFVGFVVIERVIVFVKGIG